MITIKIRRRINEVREIFSFECAKDFMSSDIVIKQNQNEDFVWLSDDERGKLLKKLLLNLLNRGFFKRKNLVKGSDELFFEIEPANEFDYDYRVKSGFGCRITNETPTRVFIEDLK